MTCKGAILVVVLAVSAPQSGYSQETQESRRKPGDPPPTRGAGDLYVTPNPRDIPRNMQELIDRSILVVDGMVTKTYPARETSPRALETDALIEVNEVLKGPNSTQSVAISQRGGSNDEIAVNPVQYSLVDVGTRWLWFLQEDRRADAPLLEGVNRYFVTGAWSGMLCVENNMIKVKARQPDRFRLQYQGRTLEEVKSEVQSLLR